jgi:membrane-associated protein
LCLPSPGQDAAHAAALEDDGMSAAIPLITPLLQALHGLETPDGIRALVQTAGMASVAAIIFAETGLLVGFFLPGDSLLMTVGVCCAPDPGRPGAAALLSLPSAIAMLSLAAVLGDQVNYLIGRALGSAIWARRLVTRRHLEEAHAFYQAWGGGAVVLGRFVPVVRTFVPCIAGVAAMPWLRFATWNLLGGVIWVAGMLTLGRWLGGQPVLRAHLHAMILAIVVISLLPILVGAARRRWSARPRPVEPVEPVEPAD